MIGGGASRLRLAFRHDTCRNLTPFSASSKSRGAVDVTLILYTIVQLFMLVRENSTAHIRLIIFPPSPPWYTIEVGFSQHLTSTLSLGFSSGLEKKS